MKTILSMANGDAEVEARLLRKYSDEIRVEVALAVVQRAEADAAVEEKEAALAYAVEEKEAALAYAKGRRDGIDIALAARTQHARLMLRCYAVDKLEGRRERSLKFSDFTLSSKRKKEKVAPVWTDDVEQLCEHFPEDVVSRQTVDKQAAKERIELRGNVYVHNLTGEELPRKVVAPQVTPAEEKFSLELDGEKLELDATQEEENENAGAGEAATPGA